MSTSRRRGLVERLRDVIYRRAFLSEHLQKSLPFQIRALREQRGWTQEELAKRCGKRQEWICKLENPNYGRFSLQTLLDVAAGFDVAFTARFISYADLLNWYTAREAAAIPSFDADPGLLGAGSSDVIDGEVTMAFRAEGPATRAAVYPLDGSHVAA